MTITILWWHIPTIVTPASFLWAIFWPEETGNGMFAGLTAMFNFIFVLVVSLLAWLIAALIRIAGA